MFPSASVISRATARNYELVHFILQVDQDHKVHFPEHLSLPELTTARNYELVHFILQVVQDHKVHFPEHLSLA